MNATGYASEQGGRHPRPQLYRHGWTSLDGEGWLFAYDEEDVGEQQRWFDPGNAAAFDRPIRVPYPPESPASGIGDTGFHPVVWYRREVAGADLLRPDATGTDRRALVHFGAVDHAARVWLDGHLVAEHVGGQTPFTADVTPFLTPDTDRHVLVVRAEDDPVDVAQPRGKQDWRTTPHDIWYHRTTGIWQSVWAETAPALRVEDLVWIPRVAEASVRAEVTLSARPRQPLAVTIEIGHRGEPLAHVAVRVDAPQAVVDIALPALHNAAERARLLWSPEHPVLLDATVTVREGGDLLDRVHSYLGMRDVGVGDGHFLLNGRPCYLRSVLDQGYWEQGHLAAPGPDDLKRDVELIKQMGFNAVRVHQKAEDPRFLYWADRLGLMVWAETANAYTFSTRAVDLLTHEWGALVRRDRSHPCVVAWVPVNESWGVPDLATDRQQQQYVLALAALTRALDPTRPVLSNEGWEHLDSDILGVHDYTTDPQALRSHYVDADAVAHTLHGRGPQGRQVMLGTTQQQVYAAGDAPLMLTEFGGISFAGEVAGREDGWGYAEVETESEYADLVRDLFAAVRSCTGVVGFCYTQFADTAQETNGLLRADRSPKLPLESIRRIVTST